MIVVVINEIEIDAKNNFETFLQHATTLSQSLRIECQNTLLISTNKQNRW